jgi:hypothetical protein
VPWSPMACTPRRATPCPRPDVLLGAHVMPTRASAVAVATCRGIINSAADILGRKYSYVACRVQVLVPAGKFLSARAGTPPPS